MSITQTKTSYAGLYPQDCLSKLTMGYIRNASKQMKFQWHSDLTKLVMGYVENTTVMKHLVMLYYPLKTVELFSLTSNYVYPKNTDEIIIHDKKNGTNILSNILILGELGNTPKLIQRWQVHFSTLLDCQIDRRYEMGCINIPKNDKSKKQFFAEIQKGDLDGIQDIYLKSKIEGVSTWLFGTYWDTTPYFHIFDGSMYTSATGVNTMENKFAANSEIKDNGDVCWTFDELLTDYTLLYEKCLEKYYSYMVVVFPTCLSDCEREPCLTCIVRCTDNKQVLNKN